MSEGLIYFNDGEVIAESGDVKIYKMNNELFLEIGPGHNLWALESERGDYIYQLNDRPFGDCLEIGLGLGVASKYILSCPKVKSLTTVEKNEDVIKAYKQLKPSDYNADFEEAIEGKPHTILNSDGLLYAYGTKKMYDFIFIDCYDRIDEDTLPIIADIALACKNLLRVDGEITGWYDNNTPENFTNAFNMLFA
jgi:predicted O-methyltransferase YrrM